MLRKKAKWKRNTSTSNVKEKKLFNVKLRASNAAKSIIIQTILKLCICWIFWLKILFCSFMKRIFFVVFAEKLGLKAAFHLLMQWFQSSVWKQSDDFFSPEDSTFRWERKHSEHPWIPGCVCQSERFHNMVVPLFSWTPGGIWLCLFCCSPPIDWIVSHLLQVLHQRSSVTTIFFSFSAASSPFHPWLITTSCPWAVGSGDKVAVREYECLLL